MSRRRKPRKTDTRRTRQASTGELASSAVNALNLLDRGIQLHDLDDPGGLKLMAGQLRQLVGRGRGNHLLQRLCTRLNRAQPIVRVTGEPRDDRFTELAMGALPREEDDGGNGSVPSQFFSGIGAKEARTLTGLMRMRVLVVDDGVEHATYTWDELLAEVANKTGPVHADEEIPVILDEIAKYRVVGIHPIAHALRSLSVVTLDVGVEVLASAGTVHRTAQRSLVFAGVWFGGMWAGGNSDPTATQKNRIEFLINVKSAPDDGTPIASGPKSRF